MTMLRKSDPSMGGGIRRRERLRGLPRRHLRFGQRGARPRDSFAEAILRMAISSRSTLWSTLNGYMADACRTYPVGICPESKLRLIKVTEQCFWNGVSKVKEGVHLGDVSHAIEMTAKRMAIAFP
jgi:methionine aminopeptidase